MLLETEDDYLLRPTLSHRALTMDRQFGSKVTNKYLPKAETLLNRDRRMCIGQQHLVFLAVEYILSCSSLSVQTSNFDQRNW